MLPMIVGRCCAMNLVVDVIATMIVAKWADVVTPCEELMADVTARWPMEELLSRMYLFMVDVSTTVEGGLATGCRPF